MAQNKWKSIANGNINSGDVLYEGAHAPQSTGNLRARICWENLYFFQVSLSISFKIAFVLFDKYRTFATFYDVLAIQTIIFLNIEYPGPIMK